MAPLLAQSSSIYRITHTYTLGGDGSWDYIVPDPPNHRLFIGRQNRVMVVDEDTGRCSAKSRASRARTARRSRMPRGTDLPPRATTRSVVMFDLKTFTVLGRIPAAEDADAIIYDSASNRVFTFNGDAHSSTVIDPQAGTLVTNIPLGGKPEYGASAGDGKVYANLTDTSEVVEIDAKTATVVAALVHGAVQAAGVDGHRHRPSSAVQRVPQRRDGGLGLSGRQGRGDGADRHGCRRRRVRCGLRRRVCRRMRTARSR